MFEKIDNFEEGIASEVHDIRKISSKIDILALIINLQREIEGLKKENQSLKAHIQRNKLASPEIVKKYVLGERFP